MGRQCFLVAATMRINTNFGYQKTPRSAFARVTFPIGAQCSPSLRLDYRKLTVFADQGRDTGDLQKPRLQRRAKR